MSTEIVMYPMYWSFSLPCFISDVRLKKFRKRLKWLSYCISIACKQNLHVTLKISNLVKCNLFPLISPLCWDNHLRYFAFFNLFLHFLFHNFIALFFFYLFWYLLFLCRYYSTFKYCQSFDITFFHFVFQTIFLQSELMTKKEILKFRLKHLQVSI